MKIILIISLSLLNISLYASMKSVFVKGRAIFVLPNQEKVNAKRGLELSTGSKVYVHKDGLVVLKDEDGSTLKVEGGAALEITKYKDTGKIDKTKETSLYTLVKGAAFFYFNSKDKNKSQFNVRTKSASFGVRGTRFFVAHGSKSKKGDVWMCVDKGLVEVSALKTKRKVLVKAGEGIKVEHGKSISTPKPLPWTRKLNWKTDHRKGSLENTVSIEEAYQNPLEVDID